MGKSRLLVFVTIAILLLWPATALGEGNPLQDTERIESFSARIGILPEGGVEVTETIVLISHGEQIQGLERLLPRWRGDSASGYEILDVHLDGAPAEYALAETEQGLKVTVGDPRVSWPAGRYECVISYRCSRLIQFLESGEGLAWNVTGYWPVPIQRVSASMEFARAPRPGFSEWSAAIDGGQAGDWTADLVDKNLLRFSSNRHLEPGEAMTVQAFWPSGYALAPPAGSRILLLDSRVVMDEERLLSVQEHITLYNEGQYDDGFSRDFPGLLRDEEGRRISRLEIDQVTLNGQDVPWRLKQLPEGQRLLVSAGNMPRGTSILTIAYTLDRQVVMAGEYEELEWQLPSYPVAVEQAKYALQLPTILFRDKLLVAGFTRLEQEADSAVFHYIDAQGNIVFACDRSLEAEESLICSVAWPQDYLAPVSFVQNLGWLVRDNASAATTVTVLVLLLVWYLLVWSRRGRRPLGRAVQVSTPPEQLSPAALRYLRCRGYDNRAFTAAVLSLAVKGCLMIVEEEGKYALVSTGIRPTNLPGDEGALLDSLFAEKTAVFPEKNLDLFNSARKVHRDHLSGQVRDNLLKLNRGWFYPAALLSLAAAALSGLLLPAPITSSLGLAGFVLWGSLAALVAVRTLALVSSLVDERGVGAVFLVLVLEIIIAALIGYGWGSWLADSFDWLTVVAAVGIILTNAVFSRLLPAPTPEGQECLVHARGFGAWLTSKNFEVLAGGLSRFEKYLPYTVALDISAKWGRRFGVPRRKGTFSPRWYQGSRWHTINAETLAASLSMLPKPAQEKM